MPENIGLLFQAEGLSFNRVASMSGVEHITDLEFISQGKPSALIELDYQEENGVELLALVITPSSNCNSIGKANMQFPGDLQEVQVCKRYFDTGYGNLLSEDCDLKILFANEIISLSSSGVIPSAWIITSSRRLN